MRGLPQLLKINLQLRARELALEYYRTLGTRRLNGGPGDPEGFKRWYYGENALQQKLYQKWLRSYMPRNAGEYPNGTSVRLVQLAPVEGDVFIIDVAYFDFQLPQELYEYLSDPKRAIVLTWSMADARMWYDTIAANASKCGQEMFLYGSNVFDLQFIIGTFFPHLRGERRNPDPGLKDVLKTTLCVEEEVRLVDKKLYAWMLFGHARDWLNPELPRHEEVKRGRMDPSRARMADPTSIMSYASRDVSHIHVLLQVAAAHPEL